MIQNFCRSPLNSNLLTTPFRVQTNWIVISGASCSGKTTLLNLLAEHGYNTVAESARQYFKEEIDKGRSLEEVREDGYALQHGIAKAQIRIENGLNPSEVLFLDRALPDILAYFRVFGIDPNEILSDCFRFRYAFVFVLDRLPFLRQKEVGPEDEVSANFTDQWLSLDYQALGYSPIRVPVLNPEERVKLILDQIKVSGLVMI